MIADVFLVLLGLGLLVAGGDVMVRGASTLARQLGVSSLAVGLTVVAFGTSAPELAVNVIAAWRGNSAMSFGNIFGSNMANIGLIVAMTALVRPLVIQNVIIRRELPMMLLSTGVALALGFDAVFGDGPSRFGRGDGVVLMLLFTVFVYYTISDVIDQRERAQLRHESPREEPRPTRSVGASLVLVGVGLVGLVAGARVTVSAATDVAIAFDVSETIIGLTLVAVGTSLPELSASIIATMRGETDLAIGNAVGSNVFNLLLVLGVSAVIRPVPIPAGGLQDVIVVGLLSMLLWLTSLSNHRTIVRAEAVLLLFVYLTYVGQRALL